jgi:hypothetical protein
LIFQGGAFLLRLFAQKSEIASKLDFLWVKWGLLLINRLCPGKSIGRNELFSLQIAQKAKSVELF